MSVIVRRETYSHSLVAVYPGTFASHPAIQITPHPRQTTSSIEIPGYKGLLSFVVETEPQVGASLRNPLNAGLFKLGMYGAGGSHKKGAYLFASLEDIEALGHYLLDVLYRVSGRKTNRANSAGLVRATTTAPVCALAPGLFQCNPISSLIPTSTLPAQGDVPPFAPAQVTVPSYSCAFGLPTRRGVSGGYFEPDGSSEPALRGYLRGGGTAAPVYVLQMSSANLQDKRAHLMGEIPLPFQDLEDLAHALLDAVTEYSGHSTDRP